MKENDRKCIKCGRSPASDPTVKLFRFPQPGSRNTYRCESWAKYCFPESQWHSQEFQKKLYSEHRMLCNRHFKATSFSDWPDSKKKLHKYAVPEVTTQEQDLTVPQSTDPLSPTCSKSAVLAEKTNIADVAVELTEVTNNPNYEKKQSMSQCKDQPGPSGTHSRQKRMLPTDEPTTSSHVEGPSVKKQKRDVNQTRERQGNIKNTKTEKERFLQMRSRKHLKKICQLRNRLDKLKNKVLLQRLQEEPSVEKLMKSLSPTFALLLQAQIKNFKKKSRGRRWTTDEKVTALRLYKRSPTCYRLLRRLFCLPAPSTLKSLLSYFELNVGINKKIFSMMGKYANKQKPSDNEYVLMFDEMSIKKNFTYNKKKDFIEGYQDHGNQGRDGQIASYALVFMVAGIRKKVKQPVAYYLSSGYVTADRLAVLIKEVLRECFQVGLNIAATVCDMDGVNRRAYAILGATVGRPTITVDNVEVTALFDPPHLLKCFRNLFLKYDIECTTNIKSNSASGIGIAKWSHIRELYELDRNNVNFVFAPALKDEHLNPNSRQKMRVYLAAQVFSHTVAIGLLAKISEGEISGEATATADLVEKIDKLFDALNSDSKDLRRGKKFNTNIKKNSPHIDFFREMRFFFESMTYIGCKNKPPSQEGWVWTLNAVEDLWGKLIKKHTDIESLATRRLQQDALENLFGCIRANCGSNSNPTVGQFTAALKTSMMSNLAHLTNTGNCEQDENEVIVNNFKHLLIQKSPNQSESGTFNSDREITGDIQHFLDSDNDNSGDQVSAGEIQACAYVCGFILKKLKHKTCVNCKKILFSEKRDIEHRFIEFKEYSDIKESLNYASREFINFIELCATETNTFLKNVGHEHGIKKKLTQKLLSVPHSFLNGCPEHFNKNFKYFTESVFYICMKRFCTLQNRQLSEENSKLKRKMNILTHK